MHPVSSAARLYALRELSRRAGVTPETFAGWKTELRGDSLILRPRPDAEIRFPCLPGGQPDAAVRKSWTGEAPASLREAVPDFVVPFCRRDPVPGEPLFRQTVPGRFECTEDLLDSAVRTLGRFEEVDSPLRDAHGRFPAAASIAVRHGFLDRPIVDEYGLALQQVLRMAAPGWEPRERALRLKLTHDIDEVGMPFNPREAAGHLLKRRAPGLFARDVLSLVSGVEPGYLSLVRAICKLSLDRGMHSALYWQAAPPGSFDSGYDPEHPKTAGVIAWARGQGVEMGVHPGYHTFHAPDRLAAEAERCRKAVGSSQIGGRQHYLRWSPETWAAWEHCGLAYDSTVGFADQAGFRAGTSIPYCPWLYRQDRAADLLEIPLIVMDTTLVNYMKLGVEESVATVKRLAARCAAVGGVFTLLWHNTSLLSPFAAMYPAILDICSGMAPYDWRDEPRPWRG